MDSIKQRQVARLIQHNLGDVFIKEGRNIYGSAFVTISDVQVTPDLLVARVYISVYNVTDKMPVIKMIDGQISLIKKRLYATIKNKMRRMPILEFYLEESLDEVFKINTVLKDLNIPKEEPGQDDHES